MNIQIRIFQFAFTYSKFTTMFLFYKFRMLRLNIQIERYDHTHLDFEINNHKP